MTLAQCPLDIATPLFGAVLRVSPLPSQSPGSGVTVSGGGLCCEVLHSEEVTSHCCGRGPGVGIKEGAQTLCSSLISNSTLAVQ